MSTFLEFRCPNQPYENSSFECRRLLGGISLDSLKNHDFDSGSFEAFLYCETCQILWVITMPSLSDGLKICAVEEGERLDTVRTTDMFKFTLIRGQRARREKHGRGISKANVERTDSIQK